MFHYQGHEYPSTEHAYQACKAATEILRAFVGGSPTPAEAKRRGQKIPVRPQWDTLKLQVMLDITRLKYQNPVLRNLLLDTGDQELIEGNTWGDTFFGVCNGVGENHLGKIIMRVRAEIQRQEQHGASQS
jgi:ribA/ribD-fused uncharacterized protein